ncbi:hypothetical protein K0M31_018032 [Melipona bicolor]|uniref:Uncharacterized protein n=1 Tax=Melipona bicolor TaxID=60889 RepID=A0AA40FDB2_9HYME|nr:hypothetical protein K0M31_018032 [Melipona bicolor]
MNGGGFARIDEEGVPSRGGLVSVTFSTPPEKAANGVHVLDYVTRIDSRDWSKKVVPVSQWNIFINEIQHLLKNARKRQFFAFFRALKLNNATTELPFPSSREDSSDTRNENRSVDREIGGFPRRIGRNRNVRHVLVASSGCSVTKHPSRSASILVRTSHMSVSTREKSMEWGGFLDYANIYRQWNPNVSCFPALDITGSYTLREISNKLWWD